MGEMSDSGESSCDEDEDEDEDSCDEADADEIWRLAAEVCYADIYVSRWANPYPREIVRRYPRPHTACQIVKLLRR